MAVSTAELSPSTLPRDPYWERRKDSIYLFAARSICRRYCSNPTSVIDVGSNKTPTLEWHRDSARRLVSIDLGRPYAADGVESIKADFLSFEVDEPFDLVTCFQVLEHIPDAGPFARKLLSIGRTCIVSVPYKWKKGRCKHHVHDPVDAVKMLSWFGREPTYQYVAKELHGVCRMIQVYA